MPIGFSFSSQVSREGERVALGPNLKARGALEDWLTAMEESMRKVLHRFIKVALTELEGINFDGGNMARIFRQTSTFAESTCVLGSQQPSYLEDEAIVPGGVCQVFVFSTNSM